MFITQPNKELFTGDHLKNEIVAFYEDLYQSNKSRLLLDKDTFLIKIADIIKILLSNDYTKENLYGLLNLNQKILMDFLKKK